MIQTIRAHERELKDAGIVRLLLFGSTARGDQTGDSDVDLLADFDKSKRYTLLTIGRLGTKVDLTSPDWLKDSVKQQALKEAIVAF